MPFQRVKNLRAFAPRAGPDRRHCRSRRWLRARLPAAGMLRRDRPVGFGRIEAPVAISRPAGRRAGASTSTMASKTRRIQHLEQQGDVVHHDPVAPAAGLLQQAVALRGDRGMHDGVESASAAGEAKTSRRRAARSRVPSGPTTPGPKAATMAACTGVPGCWASRASWSASMTVAPQRPKSSGHRRLAGGDVAGQPDVQHGRWATRLRRSIAVWSSSWPGHPMAVPAAGFVGFPPADHDGGRIVPGGPAVEEPLVAAGQVAADDADGVELCRPAPPRP